MSRARGARRWLLPWMALVPFLSSCQSPAPDVSLTPKSSLLAVDVLFPFPLSRDPSLVQAFFVRGPVHARLAELPELIPATFVKRSRAYLLDPEPGTYSLVAVTSAVTPPWNDHPVDGVSKTTWSGTMASAWILPAELIERTRTSITRGGVAFMGALRIGQGDRINSETNFQGALQKRIAELLRPGVTSESGLAGWFTMAWTVDLEASSFSDEAEDRDAFFGDARTDLGGSPWAGVIARAAPPEAPAARAPTPARRVQGAAPIPRAAAAKPRSATPEPEPAPKEPAAAPPTPQRQRFPDLPADSPLAQIESGMSHEEVREILGDPDGRRDRVTSKAWIPFYTGPGSHLRDWVYDGEGRVVFSLHDGSLEVIDVVYDPDEGR